MLNNAYFIRFLSYSSVIYILFSSLVVSSFKKIPNDEKTY